MGSYLSNYHIDNVTKNEGERVKNQRKKKLEKESKGSFREKEQNVPVFKTPSDSLTVSTFLSSILKRIPVYETVARSILRKSYSKKR